MKEWVLNKVAYAIKHYAVIQIIYRAILSNVFKFLGFFITTDDKLALFVSYGGKQYSDSPRIIFEAMKKDHRFADMKYVWAFEHPEKFSLEGSATISINSLRYFIVALKAKIWVTNVNIERGLNFKKSNTIYLNTWHGTGPKRGGNAVKGRKDYDFSRVDIFCCDGAYTKRIFTKWFNAKEDNMIRCGRPREDELLAFTEADKLSIREKLNIPNGKKICLYMPTWREYGNINLDIQLWENALSEKYVLLVRSHHFAQNNVFAQVDRDFLRDVSSYPNVNELYLVADILISDYSSAFFDYGLLNKPMICFAYDYEQFKQSTGLFIDLEKDFPNGIKRTEKEVIESIETMDYAKECEKTKKYCLQYIDRPENATKRCLDALAEKLQ